jgi:hypothetical protein
LFASVVRGRPDDLRATAGEVSGGIGG